MSENTDKNAILFNNLLNRLLYDETHGQYTLPGVITRDERDAMLHVHQFTGELPPSIIGTPTDVPDFLKDSVTAQPSPSPSPSPAPAPAPAPSPVPAPAPAAIDSDPRLGNDQPSIVDKVLSSDGIETLLDMSVLHPGEFRSDIKLGLDFGTAYSKACMMRTTDEEEVILELPLGIYAGEDALQMPVHSSLFIDPNGRLYFGPIAVERSEEARDAGIKVSRIDSIKSFLIDENRVTIDDSPLPKLYNPTDTKVSKAALLTFYLGYLLYLVRAAAKERHDVDISSVLRRISLPCYNQGHREKVIKEISKLFLMGEVLGKSFQDEWENGFRIEDVMYLYQLMSGEINKNSPYISRFLEEPLAVVGSRLGKEGISRGNVFIVVDVGAGTTDFAMFEIFANAKTGFAAAKEVKDSDYGIPVAGDKLDNILLAFILNGAGIKRDDENYREVVISLRLDIRDYKEILFQTSQLTYSLPGGQTGQVLLSDFMQEKSVQNFSKQLKDAFDHVLSSIHPSWVKTKIMQKNDRSELPVILTGGGAGLPMAKALAKGTTDVNGYKIKLFRSPVVPRWIEDVYEGEIIELYPQMAVSIGSSKEFVIDKSLVQEKYV